jgi:hypothetical protein
MGTYDKDGGFSQTGEDEEEDPTAGMGDPPEGDAPDPLHDDDPDAAAAAAEKWRIICEQICERDRQLQVEAAIKAKHVARERADAARRRLERPTRPPLSISAYAASLTPEERKARATVVSAPVLAKPPDTPPADEEEAPPKQATGMKPNLRRTDLRRFVYHAHHKRWEAADRAACRTPTLHMKAWFDERIAERLVEEDLPDPWRLSAYQMGQVLQLTYATRQLLGITTIFPCDTTAVQFRDANRAAKTRKQKEQRQMQRTATDRDAPSPRGRPPCAPASPNGRAAPSSSPATWRTTRPSRASPRRRGASSCAAS